MEIKALGGFAVPRPAVPGPRAPEQPGAAPAASPAAIYTSPILRYDQKAEVAVLLFRDPDTGETREQIPRERVV
ncbi:MAG TPA: hypothetical protein VEQ85_04380, partial [Lacipirellulaceae bacterium]|nr:hypothetical protein [Lacipirellulaceae bacterium]